jgi:hypothetical protein
MCPIISRPLSVPLRDVAATFRLRPLSPLPSPTCRLFRRKYLISSHFSANLPSALLPPSPMLRRYSLLSTLNAQRSTAFSTQVPAFTIFTPKIFSPRIQYHFFAFGFSSFSFVLIRVDSC